MSNAPWLTLPAALLLLSGCKSSGTSAPNSDLDSKQKTVTCSSPTDCTGELPTTCHKCSNGTKACAHWSCPSSNTCKVAYCDGAGGTTSGSSGTTSGSSGTGPAELTGASVPALNFAVVGDTRPPAANDLADYPSAVIGGIFQEIAGTSPQPQFVVSTGDFMFVETSSETNGPVAAPMAQAYLTAAGNFPGPFFPTLGNHECNTATTSNCGPNGADGMTENYKAYMSILMPGANIPNNVPYYSVDYSSSDSANPWTAKFVYIAANAWDSDQSAWLTQVLSKSTTYTFVVRHEPDTYNSSCTGCGASDTIVKANPYTLLITGHEHLYKYNASTSELVVGVGGAQLAVGAPAYGYVLCQQVSNGNIECNELDYNTQSPMSSYANSKVTVTPAGKNVPRTD